MDFDPDPLALPGQSPDGDVSPATEAIPASGAARIAGLATLVVSAVLAISLATYHASDLPWVHAPAGTVSNGLGLAGASLAWFAISLFGLAAFLLPPVAGAFGLRAAIGRRSGLAPLWAALLFVETCALLQRFPETFSAMLLSRRLNAAPNPGGGVGCLLYGPGMPLNRWIGDPGALALHCALALLWIALLATPQFFGEAARRRRRRRAIVLERAEDAAIENRPELEADDDAVADARADRRRRAREKRERLEAERAARQEKRQAEIAERERADEERRAEREKLRAEKAAEAEERAQQRIMEKERRRAERAARGGLLGGLFGGLGRRNRKDGNPDDDIFSGGESLAIPDQSAAGAAADATESAASNVPTLPPAQPAPAAAAAAIPTLPAAPAPAAAAPVRAPAPSPTLVPPPEALSSSPPDPDMGPFPPSEITFHLPTTRLLNPLPPDRPEDNRAEIEERSKIIEDTLAEFNLTGVVTHVVCGPTITRYEVKPESGVKVDRIQGVHSNLQMNLRARSLRIIAPIPGKDVVGLEVPNLHSRPVPLRGIAESREWKEATAKMALPMLLSRDIDGQPVIADLAKMPHMIVAGTTGSGKSVTLNAILAGWLLSRTPDQLRLVLVDPKRVEFTPYSDIPHLVVPVITEAPKVAVCLQWAVKEMDRRLKLFQRVGVRNITSFNTRSSVPRQASLFGEAADGAATGDGAPPTLPYIVIVIDEMSDLMMLAGADVEPRVVRLAQLARAVGIHLIIATQRPDVKVITGKIKANFPARIALKVASAIDSITILDQAGAQTLIGRGDMLFLNPNSSEGVTRSQSCWIDDGEIEALTRWYRDQGEPMYVPEIKDKLDRIKVKDAGEDSFKTFETGDDGGGADSGESGGGGGERAFLQRCLDVLVSADRASTSMLQRKLRLGYNKAARVIDQLEQMGCLGPANGSSPRDILRTTLPPEGGEDESAATSDGDVADDGDFGGDDF